MHARSGWAIQVVQPSGDRSSGSCRDPPNATVSVFSEDGSRIRDAVVVLKTAKLEGDRLTFDVE